MSYRDIDTDTRINGTLTVNSASTFNSNLTLSGSSILALPGMANVKTAIDAKLPLAGGTMTGMLTVSQSTNTPGLVLSGASAGWASGIKLNNLTPTTGRMYGIYVDSSGIFHITDEMIGADRISISSTGVVYFTGNISMNNNSTVDGVDISAFKSAYDSHNHDSSYYTKTQLQTASSSQVHWGNVTNVPATYAPSVHGSSAHSESYEPANANIQAHIASTSNPHSVTKAQVGLGNVPNTNIAYSSPIAADDFVQAEVDNLRANKLSNGTTPWTSYLPLAGGKITGNINVDITKSAKAPGIVWTGLTDTHKIYVEEYGAAESTRLVFYNADNGSDGATDYTVFISNQLVNSTYTDVDILGVFGTKVVSYKPIYLNTTEVIDASGNIDWARIKNKPDPTLTFTGGATGSGTMTDLGSVSIALTVDPAGHTHSDLATKTETAKVGSGNTMTASTSDATGKAAIELKPTSATFTQESKTVTLTGVTESALTSNHAIVEATGSVVVKNTAGTITYAPTTDYVINYASGTIKRAETGSAITSGQQVAVTFTRVGKVFRVLDSSNNEKLYIDSAGNIWGKSITVSLTQGQTGGTSSSGNLTVDGTFTVTGASTLGNDNSDTHTLWGNLSVMRKGTPDVTIFSTSATGVSVIGNIAVTGTVDGIDIAAFKSTYDSHKHDADYVNISGDTMSGNLAISGTDPCILLYATGSSNTGQMHQSGNSLCLSSNGKANIVIIDLDAPSNSLMIGASGNVDILGQLLLNGVRKDGNWDLAYSSTSSATKDNTAGTLIKRGTSGEIYVGKIYSTDAEFTGSVAVTNSISAAHINLEGYNLDKRIAHITDHIVFGNNDWTGMLYNTNGTVAYDSLEDGVAFSGGVQTFIRCRMPVDPESYYYIRAKVRRVSGNGAFYIGADSLDDSYTSIHTDGANSYNYFGAAGEQVAIGQTKYFSGLISGYNATTDSDHHKFDPGARYFDLFLICNYNTTDATSKFVIESLELYKAPNAMYVGSDTVWHTGNDGTGSGLDADKLDGYEATSFPRKAEDAAITGAWSFSKFPTKPDNSKLRWWHIARATGDTAHPNNTQEHLEKVSSALKSCANFLQSSENTFSGVGDNFHSITAIRFYVGTDSMVDIGVDGDDSVSAYIDGRLVCGWFGAHGADGLYYKYHNYSCITTRTTSGLALFPLGYKLTKGWHVLLAMHSELTGSDSAVVYIRQTPATPEAPGSGTNTGWMQAYQMTGIASITSCEETDPVMAMQAVINTLELTGSKFNGSDADKLDGFHWSTGATINTVAARDASGNLLATKFSSGVTSPTSPFQYVAENIQEFTGEVRTANQYYRPGLNLLRSRGTIAAGASAVADGDWTGVIKMSGHDGTQYVLGAEIVASVNGTVAAGKMPSKLGIYICDDTGTTAERATFYKNGDFSFNGSLTGGTVPWARLSGYPNITAGTGLSGGGSLSAGVTISANFGSTANTIAEGNKAVAVAAGTNLTGGGTITIGAGGTATLSLASDISLSSVTANGIVTPHISTSGNLVISSGGDIDFALNDTVYAFFDSRGAFQSNILSTNRNVFGLERNILFNATKRYTVTQTGSSTLDLPSIFDGRYEPAYTTSPGPTDADPTVITIEGLPNLFHTQAGAWVGFTTRYWNPKRFKIEGYDEYSYNSGSPCWRMIVDYSTGDYQRNEGLFKIPLDGVYTKLKLTVYEGTGDNGRFGISELFFIHPEATRPYAGLLPMNMWEGANGYVGINRNDPGYMLDVNGTARISGATTIVAASGNALTIGTNFVVDSNGTFTFVKSSTVESPTIRGWGNLTGQSLSLMSNSSATLGNVYFNGTSIYVNKDSQLVSTVSTGTAPFTVASSTQVNNLNANYLNGKTANDFAPSRTGSDIAGAGVISGCDVTGDSTDMSVIVSPGFIQSYDRGVVPTVIKENNLSRYSISAAGTTDRYDTLFAYGKYTQVGTDKWANPGEIGIATGSFTVPDGAIKIAVIKVRANVTSIANSDIYLLRDWMPIRYNPSTKTVSLYTLDNTLVIGSGGVPEPMTQRSSNPTPKDGATVTTDGNLKLKGLVYTNGSSTGVDVSANASNWNTAYSKYHEHVFKDLTSLVTGTAGATFGLGDDTPDASSIMLFKSGVLMRQGHDYTMSGVNQILFDNGCTPQQGENVFVTYIRYKA
jgi:hypothetical protein